jgi:hypothetical protein
MKTTVSTSTNAADGRGSSTLATRHDDSGVMRRTVVDASPWRARLAVSLQLVTLALLPAPPIATYALMRSSYETAICVAASGASTAATPDEAARRIAQSCELPGP